ncbi:MAG: hypothetical protein FJ253_00850 [Phycisphaerae bacterium]|nr:hypothetical protein [Phycisphaerae bacterium]
MPQLRRSASRRIGFASSIVALIVPCAAVAALLAPFRSAVAVDRTWVGATGLPPGDGVSFGDPLNWMPNGVPGSTDAALFDLVGGDITLASAFTNNQRLLARGAVVARYMMGGNVLLLNSTDDAGDTRSLVIAPDAGDLTEFEVHDGLLILDHSVIGADAGADGTLRLLAASSAISLGGAAIGEDGGATLEVAEASTLVHGDDVSAARNPGSSASITVDGAGSSWAVAGNLHLGGSIDGPGGTATVLVNAGAALSVDAALVLHPNAELDLVDADLVATSAALESARIDLDATSSAIVSEGAPTPADGVQIGIVASASLSLLEGSKLVAPSASIEAPVGSSASVVMHDSRIECGDLSIGGGASIEALLAPGSVTVGEQALMAATGTAALGGALTLVNDDPPLALGEFIDLVQAPVVDGEFFVTTTPLFGGFNFVQVPTVTVGPDTIVRAELAELDNRLTVLPPTDDPLPGVPNLVTVATFAEDPKLVDAAVTIPGATRRDPATLVVVSNDLAAPGEEPGFVEFASVAIGGDPKGLDQGAFFTEGVNDIVVSSATDGTVTVVRNMVGSLAGPAFEVSQILDLGGAPAGLGVGDLDGVNGPDVVVANSETGAFDVLLNDGMGTLKFASSVPSGTGTQSVNPLDLDQDKDIDVVAMNSGVPEDPESWTVTVNLNQLVESRGTFEFAPPVSYSVGSTPVALGTGDLNGDGAPEIVTGNAGDDTISILVNSGDGTYEQAVHLDAGGTPTALVLVDLDEDKGADLDIALLVDTVDGPSLTVFRNDTVDLFLTLVPIVDAQGVFETPSALSSGDADADGPDDLVAAGTDMGGLASTTGAISVFVADPLLCAGESDGDGVIDGSDLGSLLGDWGPNPGSPSDLDGNGVVDGGDLGILLANWGTCS